METEVVGEKDGIIYKIVDESEDDSVIKFYFNVFLPNETLSKSLNRTFDDHQRHNITEMVKARLKQRLSLVAKDARTNEIVGFLITLWLTREDFVLSPSEAYEKIKQQGFDDGQPKVVKCVKELWSGKSIFDLFPLEQKVADACNLAVAQEYSRRGIGGELAKRGLLICKKSGFNIQTVACTGVKSQKIYDKLGFTRHSAIKYENYLDENGKVIFRTDEKEVVAMYKTL